MPEENKKEKKPEAEEEEDDKKKKEKQEDDALIDSLLDQLEEELEGMVEPDEPISKPDSNEKVSQVMDENNKLRSQINELLLKQAKRDALEAQEMKVKIADMTADWDKPFTLDEMDEWELQEVSPVHDVMTRYRSGKKVDTAPKDQPKPKPKVKRAIVPSIPVPKEDSRETSPHDAGGHVFSVRYGG